MEELRQYSFNIQQDFREDMKKVIITTEEPREGKDYDSDDQEDYNPDTDDPIRTFSGYYKPGSNYTLLALSGNSLYVKEDGLYKILYFDTYKEVEQLLQWSSDCWGLVTDENPWGLKGFVWDSVLNGSNNFYIIMDKEGKVVRTYVIDSP
jgi:hypothetical protein